MDLYSVLLVSFAVAFVVSVVDYFVDFGIWRAGLAVILSSVGALILGLTWQQGALSTLAAAFLAMAFLAVIERINFRPRRMR